MKAEEKMRRSKRHFLYRYGWLLLAAGMVAVALSFALKRIYNVNFVCTNGDYQNYNVIRRVLDGQIPYRDFANYLGMGAIFLQAPLVVLHNNFAGSLFVANFVISVIFMLLVYLVFYFVTGERALSALAALLFPKFIDMKLFTVLPGVGLYTNYNLELLSRPGNSMRMARLFLPVLYGLLSLGLLAWQKRRHGETHLRSLLAERKTCAVLGLAVGLGMTWSNDFGFACIGGATLILVILASADSLQKTQAHPWRRFYVYVPALLAGMLLSMLIASGGHMESYLQFTKGVAGWQFWYYGYDSQDKIYSLAQLFGNRRFLLQLLIYLGTMGFALFQLIKKRESDRLILFTFLYTSIFAAQCIYLLGSGNNGFTEGSASLVILLFWALLLKGILFAAQKLSLGKALRVTAVVLSILFAGFMTVQDIFLFLDYQAQKIPQQTEYYLPSLGGVSSSAKGLNEMAQRVDGASLFSTYATALDDMRGGFQPTGCDYIIHALGNEQYAAYIEKFSQQSYSYVQTTNHKKWLWEPWTVNASWDFYRMLYSDYRRQGDYDLWTLWEYAGENENILPIPVELEVKRIDEHRVELAVTSEEARPCYVDVTVSWDNAWVNNAARLQTWAKSVFVFDDSQKEKRGGTGEGYYRPPQAQTAHLMIFMDGGKGKITLAGYPENCTQLQVRDVKIGKVIAYQG